MKAKLIYYYDLGLNQYVRYKKIGQDISLSILYRIGIVAINFISGVIVSRELLQANRGVFQLFLTSLVLFNTLLNFGFNNSVAYFAQKNPEKLRLYLSNNFILSIVSSVIIAICLVIFKNFFTFQSSALVVLFVFSYVCYSFSAIYRGVLIGINKTLYYQKLDFYLRLTYFVAVLLFYYLDSLTVFNILLYISLEYLLFSVIASRHIGLKLFPLQLETSFLKETFSFNTKTYISMVLGFAILRLDQYAIKFFLGNYNVGQYSAGSTIVENMCLVTGMISAFYLPKLLASNDLNEILKKSNKLLFIMFFISVMMSIVVYFLSPFIIELYFKKENLEGTNSLRALLIGFVFWSLFIFIQTIYLSIRFKKSLLVIMFFCLVLNFIINYIYLPKLGIIAAAWSSSITYFLLFILSYFDLFYLKKKNFLNKVSNEE